MSRRAALAALAAAVASAADLAMLWVANAANASLALTQPPRGTLEVGAVLGVVSIPFYAVGYRAVAAALHAQHARAARIVAFCGTAGAGLGALIHALTARYVANDVAAGVAGQDPLAAIAGWGALLPALWGAATVAIVAASIALAAGLRAGDAGLPGALAWANPACVTILLAAVGFSSPLLRAFLVPAAPNLAHVVFFGACAWAARPSYPATKLRSASDPSEKTR